MSAPLPTPLASFLCQICLEAPFQYTCPRCELVYCSVRCYKSHSQDCTEKFFHEKVIQQLKNDKPSDAEKNQFERRLNALRVSFEETDDLHGSNAPEIALDNRELWLADPEGRPPENCDSNDASSEEDEGLTESRIDCLRTLAEQDALDLDKLTQKELQQFASALKRGLLTAEPSIATGDNDSHLNNSGKTPFLPWWFQELSVLEQRKTQHICCSNKKSPGRHCLYLLLEFIFGYVCAFRRLQGDLLSHANVENALEFLLIYAPNLKPPKTTAETECKTVSASPISAISSSPSDACISTEEDDLDSLVKRMVHASQEQFFADAKEIESETQFRTLCLIDVNAIMKSKFKVLKALEELEQCMKIMRNARQKTGAKPALRLMIKKIQFFKSFVEFHLGAGVHIVEFDNIIERSFTASGRESVLWNFLYLIMSTNVTVVDQLGSFLKFRAKRLYATAYGAQFNTKIVLLFGFPLLLSAVRYRAETKLGYNIFLAEGVSEPQPNEIWHRKIANMLRWSNGKKVYLSDDATVHDLKEKIYGARKVPLDLVVGCRGRRFRDDNENVAMAVRAFCKRDPRLVFWFEPGSSPQTPTAVRESLST